MPAVIFYLSLFLLPLVGPLTISPIVSIRDLWLTKEFAALLSIILIWTFSTHSRRPDRLIQAGLIFILISNFSTPPIVLQLGASNLSDLWCWKAFFWVLAYYLLYETLQNIKIDRNLVAKAIAWTAFISACYALVQSLNIDQFQVLRDFRDIGWKNSNPNMTSMIGSSVYLSVFLGICLPFCIYALRWWQAAVVGLTIVALGSDTGTVFGLATIALYFLMRAPLIWTKFSVVILAVAVGLVLGNWQQIRPKIQDNGRFAIYRETFNDWKSPPISMEIKPEMTDTQKRELTILNARTQVFTGRGIGSFEYMFQRKHSGWNATHNVYLQTLYELGLGGLLLLFALIIRTLWGTFWLAREDDFVNVLFCSFIFILLAALTTPMLLIEPIRYFVVGVFSLLAASIPAKK